MKLCHVDDIRNDYIADDFRVHGFDLHSFKVRVELTNFKKFDGFLVENSIFNIV